MSRTTTTGAELIMGTGRFVAPKTLEVPLNDGRTRVLAGDRVFLSVGTHAAIPSIPGLEAARPLTGAASRSRSGGSMAGDGRRPETIATIQTTMIHEEGRTARPPESSGRTRMIVFPLRRSVGLKAATAS